MFYINVRQAGLSGEASSEEEARAMFREYVNRAVKSLPVFPKVMVERVLFDDWVVAHAALLAASGAEPKSVQCGAIESYAEFFAVRYIVSSCKVNDTSVITRSFQMHDMRQRVRHIASVRGGKVVSLMRSQGETSDAAATVLDLDTGAPIAIIGAAEYQPGVGMTTVKKDMAGNMLDEVHYASSPAVFPVSLKERLAAFPYLGNGKAWSDISDEFYFSEDIADESAVPDEIKLEIASIIDAVAPKMRERVRLSSAVQQRLENGVSILVDTSNWLN